MKLTAQIKLLPSPDQHQVLRLTLEKANQACNHLSEWAWNHQVFGQYAIHHGAYRETKSLFGLSAQMVVRCIAKVADAYKLDRKKRRRFHPRGAISYDDRILRWYPDQRAVSIWTVEGRIRVPFTGGAQQLDLLNFRGGESDLVFQGGQFFLLATCEVEEGVCQPPGDFLGVDLGIKNLATDSEGEIFSGGQVNGLRKRHARLRSRLQAKGTPSAQRLLKRRRRKESRFARDVNHTLSKKLVAKAQGTGCGIALEDLRGIRDRLTVKKPQRRTQHSWAFAQLRAFIEYKARRAGVKVVLVDPRNTSRTCPRCEHTATANRPSRDGFSCIECGFSGHADYIAAVNIRRAAVNQPYAEAAA